MALKNSRAIREVKALASGERYDAYAKRTDGLMLALAVAFLIIWTVTTVATGIPTRIGRAMALANYVIWFVFFVDLVIRIIISKSSWRFVVKHPLDILAVLIPHLRPLKILTIFTSGTKLITSRGAAQTSQAVVISVVLLIWVGAVAVFGFEHDAVGAQITTFREALWWALVTVTTVGYGDVTPVTGEGRIVAGAMMIVGIALLGVVTASVAAWFVKLTNVDKDQREEASIAKNEREIKKLHHKIDELETKIDVLVERGRPTGD